MSKKIKREGRKEASRFGKENGTILGEIEKQRECVCVRVRERKRDISRHAISHHFFFIFIEINSPLVQHLKSSKILFSQYYTDTFRWLLCVSRDRETICQMRRNRNHLGEK